MKTQEDLDRENDLWWSAHPLRRAFIEEYRLKKMRAEVQILKLCAGYPGEPQKEVKSE